LCVYVCALMMIIGMSLLQVACWAGREHMAHDNIFLQDLQSAVCM